MRDSVPRDLCSEDSARAAGLERAWFFIPGTCLSSLDLVSSTPVISRALLDVWAIISVLRRLAYSTFGAVHLRYTLRIYQPAPKDGHQLNPPRPNHPAAPCGGDIDPLVPR